MKIIPFLLSYSAEKTNDLKRNKDINHLHEVQRDLNQLRDYQNDIYEDAENADDADSESSDIDDVDIKAIIFFSLHI